MLGGVALVLRTAIGDESLLVRRRKRTFNRRYRVLAYGVEAFELGLLEAL